MNNPKVTFTKTQRAKAKAEGLKLCAIYTPGVAFGGPCTPEEHDEIVRFMHAFLKRRFDRLRESRLHGEQPREGGSGG